MTDLWPHQLAALDALERILQREDRTQLHMACGTGKTRVAMELIRRRGDSLVAVVMPTIELIAQTAMSARQVLGGSRQYFVVGAPNERDIAGLPTLREPADIARILANSGPTLALCTYASLPYLGAALRKTRKKLDLAIADEAHKTAGLESRLYSFWLDDSDFPARKRLAMTATPRVVAGGVAGLKVYSMDDRQAYGPIAFAYPYSRAVEDGIICDLDALVPIIEGEDTMETRARALIEAIEQHGLRKIMTFHATISEAQAFADTLITMGHPAKHVNGRSSRSSVKAAREALLGDDEVIVTNARLFGEGIDVPALDAVFFASFRRSIVDITQQVGRAVRRAPGKSKGYVILPPATPGDISAILDSTRLRPLWSVISGLFDLRQPYDSRWEYGRDAAPKETLTVIPIGGDEEAAETLRQGLSELVEVRQVGVRDWAFAARAREAANYIDNGGLPFGSASPHRIWLADVGRAEAEGRLNPSRLAAWKLVQDAMERRKSGRREELEAYVRRIEAGGRRNERLTQTLRRNSECADLWERYEHARRTREAEQRARAVALIEILEAGGSTMADQNMAATLFKTNPNGSGIYADLVPRFQAAMAAPKKDTRPPGTGSRPRRARRPRRAGLRKNRGF